MGLNAGIAASLASLQRPHKALIAYAVLDKRDHYCRFSLRGGLFIQPVTRLCLRDAVKNWI